MFYGAVIKPNSSVQFDSNKSEVLHISSACLKNPTNDERTYLVLYQKDKPHILCSLKKDVSENVTLDLFITTREGGYLKVEGKSDVHVTGYYEPMIGDSDEELSESDEEISEDDEQIKKKDLSGSKKKIEIESDYSASDDEKSDDMDDIKDDNSDDDRAFEDSDNDEDDEEDEDKLDEELMRKAIKEQVQKKNAESKKKQAMSKQPQKSPAHDKKRKSNTDLAFSKPGKQQKSNLAQTDEQKGNVFDKNISDYLKKHGRTLISQVAAACPKPATLKIKYREYLVGKPGSYEVEGQYVRLKNQ